MVDPTNIKRDYLRGTGIKKSLKTFVVDVHGDIAGVKGNTVIVTPTGIKIDRSKIIGGKY